jgi:UDP-N-acetylglucosamine 1-carboxyvinyltransferase
MPSFRIEGGHRLNGEVTIQGAKNAALPLLSATLLTEKPCTLSNIPRIEDVLVMLELITSMGASVEWLSKNQVRITTANLNPDKIDHILVRKLRASILLIGPLLARFGKVRIPYPGGCVLGKRPMDTHFSALEALGASVSREGEDFLIEAAALKPARIFLREASVTATENTLTTLAGIPGESQLRNAASEPHVTNLCEALVQMGAVVEGMGGHELKITGKKDLAGFDIMVIPDQLEVGSFAVLPLVTGGEISLYPVVPDHLDPILIKFDDIGVDYTLTEDRLTVRSGPSLKAFNLTTNVWPGFPTDLQSPFAVLATQCQGNSMIHDWMYEGRLFYIDKLIKMGADIILCDPHRIIVSGPRALSGKTIESPDIRAGMALLIAALAAEGESIIEHVGLIDRGYLNVEQRLSQLGARIERRS